jgi:hypothetical protein
MSRPKSPSGPALNRPFSVAFPPQDRGVGRESIEQNTQGIGELAADCKPDSKSLPELGTAGAWADARALRRWRRFGRRSWIHTRSTAIARPAGT